LVCATHLGQPAPAAQPARDRVRSIGVAPLRSATGDRPGPHSPDRRVGCSIWNQATVV
jgi:hypothetical protein